MLRTLIVVTLLAASPALADEAAERTRTLSVIGTGEVAATPDMARVELGVTSEGQTAGQALQLNSKAMAKVFEALKSAGIADKDVQTTTVSLSPVWTHPEQRDARPTITGYQASNSVTVTVHKFDALGALLDNVTKAGANNLGGISFDVAGREDLLDEARKQATADARRKAAIYAAGLGVTLGEVVAISESGAYQPVPQPMFRATMAEAAGAPPIAGGEQKISATVSVVFEIE